MWDELAAFLLAGSCAGCDASGTLLCEVCAVQLRPQPLRQETPSGLQVVSALRYEGVAARCIRRLKEEGETLLARRLGPALRAAADSVTPPGQPIAFVPLPTGRAAFRRRGYRVPELLTRQAGLEIERLLAPGRAIADQRELGRAERERNVRGSVRMRRRGADHRVILVDDVITTGATIDEAASVLREAGVDVLGAVTLASTPLHRKFIHDSSEMSRDIR